MSPFAADEVALICMVDPRIPVMGAIAREARRRQSLAELPPVAPAGPVMGIWLWHVDRTGYTHPSLAAKLEELGIGRVLVKVGEGSADCDAWPELCDEAIVATYHGHGLEAYAWAFSHPGREAVQAAILTRAAETGYDGFVLDIEQEFDGSVTSLTRLLTAHRSAVDALVANGTVPPGWPLGVTTWGNPADHDMHVEIIDRYADMHLPQVYIAEWGDTTDPAASVRTAVCEYRALGAMRPVNPIVSNASGAIDAAGLNAFAAAGGPESSVWRVPGRREPQRWVELEAIEWSRTDFDAPPTCLSETSDPPVP